jgi:hypothetical protein
MRVNRRFMVTVYILRRRQETFYLLMVSVFYSREFVIGLLITTFKVVHLISGHRMTGSEY